ncbi:MAG: tetratricopeptide repeat protein [Streptosporangiaceae bacterium]
MDQAVGADGFGAMLRRQRLAAGLTQEQLAGRAEISVRAISDLERGRTTRPFRHSVRMLAAALGLEGAAAEEFAAHALAGSNTFNSTDTAVAPRGSPDPAEQSSQQRTDVLVPRQLPAGVRHFTGRRAELDALTGLLAEPGQTGSTVVISAIDGMAGIGKTALAVHFAHRVVGAFPDGQLYVNLRGYDPREPVSPADALGGFLRALGADGRRIPADEQERAAMYRSLLAGRRVLVVLDNAREAQQVRPLLPGAVGCLALVTSRGSLAGLAARDGAVRLRLDALAPGDAVALLRELLGPRARDDPDALAALSELCCRLPLALRLAAEVAASRPTLPLSGLAGELADLRRRLDVLDADADEATAVRSVFSWSYRNLETDAARMFRLSSLHPGADFDLYAAAALTATSGEQASRLLGRLSRAHLLHAATPGRYGMHDLLRVYARELADTHDGECDRHAALTGLLEYYLHTAAAAMDTLYPAEARRRPRLAAPTGIVAPVGEPAAARAWLDAELANLIAVAALAAEHGWPGHAIALAGTVERYLSFGYHLAEASAIHRHALYAARHGGNLAAEATSLTHLGFIALMQNRYQQALDYQQQALALFQRAGDRHGQTRALHRLALVERSLGQLEASAGHAAQVLAITRQDGDRLGQARALQSLGQTRQAQGRSHEAGDHLRQALTLLDALADRLGQSVTVKDLGVIELGQGHLELAAEYFRRALALCLETNNPSGQAEALSRLGLTHLRSGRHEQAVEHQQRALTIYRQIKEREGEGEVLARLALADLQAGRHQQAFTHLEQALRLSRELGLQLLEATVLNGLGEALLTTGEPDQARVRHAAALDLSRQTGGHDEQARAHRGLAHAHTALGNRDEAEHHRKEALTLETQPDIAQNEAQTPPGSADS